MHHNPEPPAVDLSNLSMKIIAHKGLVGVLMLGGGATLAAYAFLSPAAYSASATLVSMQAIRPLEMAAPRVMGLSAQDPLLVLRGIITSRSNLERVAQKSGAKLKELQDKLTVETESERGQIILTCIDADPSQAQKVIESTISSLRETMRSINFSSAELSAANLEKTITEREGQLKADEERFLVLQKATRAVVSPNDMKGLAELSALREEKRLALGSIKASMRQMESRMAGLENARIDVSSLNPATKSIQTLLNQKELDLRLAKVSQTDKSFTVVRLTKEVAQVREKLKELLVDYVQSLRQGLDEQVAGKLAERAALESQLNRLDELVSAAPSEALSLSRSYRQVQQLTATLSELKVQYEKAKINASVEQVTWNTLDKPYVGAVSRGSRAVKYGVAGVALGFFLAVISLFFLRPKSVRAV